MKMTLKTEVKLHPPPPPHLTPVVMLVKMRWKRITVRRNTNRSSQLQGQKQVDNHDILYACDVQYVALILEAASDF